MRRLWRVLRLIPLAFACAFFATAALKVYSDRTDESIPLPNRIGQSQTPESFLEATFAEMTAMYTTVLVAYFPGMVPSPVALQQKDPFSLEALEARTRAPARFTY